MINLQTASSDQLKILHCFLQTFKIGLGEIPLISSKIIGKINILSHKTDIQTSFKVDKSTLHKNTFNINKF